MKKNKSWEAAARAEFTIADSYDEKRCKFDIKEKKKTLSLLLDILVFEGVGGRWLPRDPLEIHDLRMCRAYKMAFLEPFLSKTSSSHFCFCPPLLLHRRKNVLFFLHLLMTRVRGPKDRESRTF